MKVQPRRLAPVLYHRHRGFCIVVTSLTVFHLILAADCLTPGADRRHSKKAWDLIAHWFGGVHGIGVTHASLAAVLIVGLSAPGRDLILIRVATALSVTMFTFQGVSFLAGHSATASYFSVGACVFVLGVGVAFMLEPSRNPDSERELDRRRSRRGE